jgi:hypothetical protein
VLQRILERRPVPIKQSAKPTTVTESLSNLNDTLAKLDSILSDWPDQQSRRAARVTADTIGARAPARSIE